MDINENLKDELKKAAQEAFGSRFQKINIQATEDHYGDAQISVECLLDVGASELTDAEMTDLAKKDMKLKLKFLKAFRDLGEERPLFSSVSFVNNQDKEAA